MPVGAKFAVCWGVYGAVAPGLRYIFVGTGGGAAHVGGASLVTPFLVVCIPETYWAGFAGVPVGHVPPATVIHVCVWKPFIILLGVVVC